MKWLSDYAHSKGMVIGLKNALDIITDVITQYDFAVNEKCYTYDEFDSYAPFTKANKAVFSHIYKTSAQLRTSICANASKNKLVT